jgi:hypothetical protein
MIAEPDIAALMRAFHKAGLDDPALRTIAVLLACLTIIRPSPRRQGRTRGRPKKPCAAYAANIVMGAIESITGSRADLPISLHNARPRGVEPVVREVLALLGIAANPRAAIHAALTEREQQRGRRPCPFPARGIDAEAFFARRSNNMLSNNTDHGSLKLPRHDRTTH